MCACEISASHSGLTHSLSDTAESWIIIGASLSYRQAAMGEKGHVFWRLCCPENDIMGKAHEELPNRLR